MVLLHTYQNIQIIGNIDLQCYWLKWWYPCTCEKFLQNLFTLNIFLLLNNFRRCHGLVDFIWCGSFKWSRMDMEENENADFEIYKIICLFLNLLKFYGQIFVTNFGGHLGALEVRILIWIFWTKTFKITSIF